MAISLDARRELTPLQMSFSQAVEARRPHEPIWRLCAAYHAGRQWRRRNVTTNRLEDIPTTDRNRTRVVYNRIQPAVMRTVAHLLMNRPKPVAMPKTTDEDDILAARVCEQLWSSLYDKMGWHQALREAVTWGVVAGIGWLCPYFDPDLGPLEELPTIDEFTGDLAETKDTLEGEINLSVASPFQVYVDPQARTWGEVQWLERVVARRRDYVSDRYPDRRGELGPDPEARLAYDYEMEIMGSNLTTAGYTNPLSGGYEILFVHERFEKPNRRYPRGRWITWSSAAILREQGLPGHRRLPLVPIIYEQVPGRIYGRGIVEGMLWPQSLLNQVMSREYDEHRLAGNSIWLIPIGAMRSKQVIGNDSGARIEYNAPLAPQRVPPNLPNYGEIISTIERQLGESSMQHEAFRGATPPANIRSGLQTAYLFERDANALNPPSRNIELAVAEVFGQVIGLAGEHYPDEKLLRVIGKNRQPELIAFRREQVDRIALEDVTVEAGSALPDSKLAKRQEMAQLYQMGVIRAYAAEQERNAAVIFLRATDQGNLASVIEQADLVLPPPMPPPGEGGGLPAEMPGGGMMPGAPEGFPEMGQPPAEAPMMPEGAMV